MFFSPIFSVPFHPCVFSGSPLNAHAFMKININKTQNANSVFKMCIPIYFTKYQFCGEMDLTHGNICGWGSVRRQALMRYHNSPLDGSVYKYTFLFSKRRGKRKFYLSIYLFLLLFKTSFLDINLKMFSHTLPWRALAFFFLYITVCMYLHLFILSVKVGICVVYYEWWSYWFKFL